MMTYCIDYIPRLDSKDPAGTIHLLHLLTPQPIGCNNWPERFPYSPQVNFRIAHNGPDLFLLFQVSESCTQACISEDNGEVWTDSCVELFISVDDNGYYNFEFTCIGKMLLGFRKERPGGILASPNILQTIKRYSSLGNTCFEERKGDQNWHLLVSIPATALFRHQLQDWQNVQARANLYKCGDRLSQPHYLSWSPIHTEKPDFHVPQYFTKVLFNSR